jgi:hypothetical protein
MHLDDQIPIVISHVLEADITQDAGVINKDVDPAEGPDSRIDDTIAVLYAVVVRDGPPARGANLLNHDIGSLSGEILNESHAATENILTAQHRKSKQSSA